jgi:hypothetical protein
MPEIPAHKGWVIRKVIMAEILAIGNIAANSPDFTLTGESSSLLLTNTDGVLVPGAYADIQAKTSGASYIRIGRLTIEEPLLVISAPGTYRVSRPTGGSCGVDRS